jgi:hypothetical protein
MKYLTEYVQTRNAFAKIFGKPVINLSKITKTDIQNLMDDLENDLSPENLTCDGELSGARLVQKANKLKAAYSELQTLSYKVA